MKSLYGPLKDKLVGLVEAMMNLPQAPVWIHEKALYNLVGITGGRTYGRNEVLTYLLQGIKKGYFGNTRDKDVITLTYGASNLFEESNNNEYNMTCQHYGVREKFQRGSLCKKEQNVQPRWFQKGVAPFDVNTQTDVVDELIGESNELETSVASRRPNNFAAFVRNDGTDDAGYERKDVMHIISDYEDELDICRNASERYHSDDLERVKDVLRLMIVASGKAGKLEVRNGQLVPNKSLRAARGDIVDTTTKTQTAVTPASKKRTTEQCAPNASAVTPTPKKAFGALRLEEIRCTNDEGFINMPQVKQLASLELLFDLYTTNSRLYEDANEAVEKTKEQMIDLNVSLPNTFQSGEERLRLASMSPQLLVQAGTKRKGFKQQGSKASEGITQT